ncbi:MAG: sulfatase-like hydrolase/transferase [Bacteroides sp.]|nr:sulfatase-like hydrolase/transferase [Bacteroides sp.]
MKAFYPLLTLFPFSQCITAQERPNFLIIQCDHLTQRVTGAYGETEGCTPAIDRIAEQGVVFANAYVGCPLSQPSRAGLWSGLMPHQTRIRSNSGDTINPHLPEHIPTLGSIFSSQGYRAVHFGKTHDMGALRGFTHKEPVARPFDDPEFPLNKDSYLDVGTCEDVTAFLSSAPEQPFICIADFLNPHNICGYVGTYEGEHINPSFDGPLPELPENFEVSDWEALPVPIQYICCSHRRMTQAAHWSEENYRHYIAAFQHYTRMVSRQIGHLLETLYATPAGKNTIVVILSDHGDGMASHRMVTKQISFYEEITNVPFIFAGPGIVKRENPVKELLTHPTTDLLPTLCELAGIDIPLEKPGISLAPFLWGKEQKRRHPYVVSEWHSEYEVIVSPGRMIRSPHYKYTHYLEGEGEELYDLRNDPGETRNLARDGSCKEVLEAHREMLEDYILRTADDYRSLNVKADPQWRRHTPGYPHHEGATAQ